MADPFLGQIIMFGGSFAPRAWALCEGQLLAISQHNALFAILGTIYGGDGRTTFGLPDLRGRVAVHAGQGPGLAQVRLGQRGGQEQVTLTTSALPAHSHAVSQAPSLEVRATRSEGNQPTPSATVRPAAAKLSLGHDVNLYATGGANTTLGGLQVSGAATTANTGGGQSHDNMQPAQVVSYIIALQGVFPSRN